jgi:hypothetical protein
LFLMSPAMYDLTTFMAYGAPTGKYMWWYSGDKDDGR